MRRKHKDLQSWLDYFVLLQKYEDGGFLEVFAEKHEAYVTRAALFTLSPVVIGKDMASWTDAARLLTKNMPKVIRRIRSYAAWLSREGAGYPSRPFVLHVVHEDAPHDLLYTLVVTSRRRWWKLWMWHDSIEVIDYTKK